MPFTRAAPHSMGEVFDGMEAALRFRDRECEMNTKRIIMTFEATRAEIEAAAASLFEATRFGLCIELAADCHHPSVEAMKPDDSKTLPTYRAGSFVVEVIPDDPDF